MKKRWITILVIFIFAVISLFYYLGKRDKKIIDVKSAKVLRGKITAFFSTNGSLESKNKRDYYIQSPVKVKKINASIGDRVKKGDIIAELEVQNLSLELRKAEIAYNSSKLQLEILKKRKKDSDKLLQQPGQQQNLMQQGDTDLYNIEDQIEIQKNQVEIAKLNLETVKEAINKQQRYIKADINGAVTALNLTEGGLTPIQVPAATVEDNLALRVSISINQFDVLKIKKGQYANIKFSDFEAEGVVESINPSASKVMSATGTDTIVKGYVDIVKNVENLIPGLDVDVDIKIGEKDDVLIIPLEAVITDKYGKESVYVLNGTIVELRDIKTGLSSDTEIEVISGLKENEKVILNPPSALRQGYRVSEKGV